LILLADNQRLKMICKKLHQLKPDDLEKNLAQAEIYRHQAGQL